MISLVEVSSPGVEPITAAEFRAHARFDDTSEDTLIGAYITAARVNAEKYTRRAFITRNWKLVLDSFPALNTIKIWRSPLISVSAITYVDVDGATQTLDPTHYVVEALGEPGRVVRAYRYCWPITRCHYPGAVQVAFSAGYGAAAVDVPEGIKTALKFYVSHYFETREPGNASDMPEHVKTMLSNYRVF